MPKLSLFFTQAHTSVHTINDRVLIQLFWNRHCKCLSMMLRTLLLKALIFQLWWITAALLICCACNASRRTPQCTLNLLCNAFKPCLHTQCQQCIQIISPIHLNRSPHYVRTESKFKAFQPSKHYNAFKPCVLCIQTPSAMYSNPVCNAALQYMHQTQPAHTYCSSGRSIPSPAGVWGKMQPHTTTQAPYGPPSLKWFIWVLPPHSAGSLLVS